MVARLATAALCLFVVGACSSPSPILYKPTVDASILLPCVDPILAPEEATDNELAAERLRVAKAYLDCKARHGALAERVNQPLAAPKKTGWLF